MTSDRRTGARSTREAAGRARAPRRHPVLPDDGRRAAARARPRRRADGGSERDRRQLPRVRPDRPLEAELRALIHGLQRGRRAHRFEEVLDAVGEQACKVLRAVGISISR